MKLNWFSPLPPARSAIAAYAATVLPELQRQIEVTAWSADRHRSPVPWEEINRGDVSLYHIGNHALFHADIWELSRQQPGIVVLHDARLHEFVLSCCSLSGDRERYLALMRRHHGTRGARAAEDVWNQIVPVSTFIEDFPLTAAIVDRALGVVVHSIDALELVEPHTCGPILCTALPYQPTCASIALRPWQRPFRLIMFGFLGDTSTTMNPGRDTTADAIAFKLLASASTTLRTSRPRSVGVASPAHSTAR